MLSLLLLGTTQLLMLELALVLVFLFSFVMLLVLLVRLLPLIVLLEIVLALLVVEVVLVGNWGGEFCFRALTSFSNRFCKRFSEHLTQVVTLFAIDGYQECTPQQRFRKRQTRHTDKPISV